MLSDQSRYWSPYQSYITGDVLRDLIVQGWTVTDSRLETQPNRSHLYIMTLQSGDQRLILRVLDNPFVRAVAQQVATPSLH